MFDVAKSEEFTRYLNSNSSSENYKKSAEMKSFLGTNSFLELMGLYQKNRLKLLNDGPITTLSTLFSLMAERKTFDLIEKEMEYIASLPYISYTVEEIIMKFDEIMKSKKSNDGTFLSPKTLLDAYKKKNISLVCSLLSKLTADDIAYYHQFFNLALNDANLDDSSFLLLLTTFLSLPLDDFSYEITDIKGRSYSYNPTKEAGPFENPFFKNVLEEYSKLDLNQNEEELGYALITIAMLNSFKFNPYNDDINYQKYSLELKEYAKNKVAGIIITPSPFVNFLLSLQGDYPLSSN